MLTLRPFIAHDFTTNDAWIPEGESLYLSRRVFSSVSQAQEKPNTPKTAWEYYNESMEIIDRQRARDWIEQMDTILIFVRTSYS